MSSGHSQPSQDIKMTDRENRPVDEQQEEDDGLHDDDADGQPEDEGDGVGEKNLDVSCFDLSSAYYGSWTNVFPMCSQRSLT